jgi:ABC-type oligopeptide transport system substrate-binding subunit
MKTKIIALFAILALAFVGLNTTSCSKDDDDSSSSTSDSASLGKTDGTAFANAYATYKAKGYTSVDEINCAIPTILLSPLMEFLLLIPC